MGKRGIPIEVQKQFRNICRSNLVNITDRKDILIVAHCLGYSELVQLLFEMDYDEDHLAALVSGFRRLGGPGMEEV